MTWLIALWQRIPVVPRALFAGFVVATVGQVPAQALVAANIAWLPAIPWGAAAIAAWLWLYWRWLSGRGWPRETAELRHFALRAGPLSPRVWRWSLIAAAISSLALRMMLDLARRLSTRPAQDLVPQEELARHPFLAVLLLFVASAATAGVVEEASFRGYMQAPIERRHGPVTAIAIVALVFSLAHYRWEAPDPVPWLTFIPCYVAVSVGYGTIAWLTGSIVPGIIGHTCVDLAAFLRYWWLGVPGPVWQVGLDGLFWTELAVMLLAAAAAVWALRRLAAVVKSERAAGVQPGAAVQHG
ncbi:MAG TPA: CPBP family intramembrane glutamic endopeptidase [Candidatus Eisenbacteria bacterium]|jgi:membrane protease YdiL (CAAX protease family)